jgi:hypothetical protein
MNPEARSFNGLEPWTGLGVGHIPKDSLFTSLNRYEGKNIAKPDKITLSGMVSLLGA